MNLWVDTNEGCDIPYVAKFSCRKIFWHYFKNFCFPQISIVYFNKFDFFRTSNKCPIISRLVPLMTDQGLK